VEWQFRVAAGEALPLKQSAIKLSGHAIEARLCTEDPVRDFRPSAGRIALFEPASGEALRIETGIETGSEVPPFYDSMVAKLITSGPDRETARARLVSGLRETVLAGPQTNARFLTSLLEDDGVKAGRMDTGLIGREIARLTAAPELRPVAELGALHLVEAARDAVLAARAPHVGGWRSPWDAGDGFQLGSERRQTVKVLADGEPLTFDLWWRDEGPVVPVMASNRPEDTGTLANAHVIEDGDRVLIIADMLQTEVAWPIYDPSSVEDEGGGTLRAPINGRVAKMYVTPGATIAKGDRVAVVEAMKMEHVVTAPRDGTIASVGAKEGDQVVQGTPLATLAEAQS
ncbi:MAG TPA: carbamoyl-phosphate synthase subunit L, partial [Hyphomicrobiaceae bacterium]|nr:carbamoyl-phosphate synthase subunit L [Hyphomicrobiaceae bacterium]